MATGKTQIGKELVKRLGSNYRFIETDQMIVKMVGKSIDRIFKEDGEEIFRQHEFNLCKSISKEKNVVISCGGGIVLNNENIKNLKKNCYIVLLKASIDEIYDRIMKNGQEKRPLIDKENPRKEIRNLLNIRNSLYEKAADISIDTTNKQIDDIVKEILIKLKISA